MPPATLAIEQPTPSAVAPRLPSRIGKYVVKSKLGEGATSEVFLAHDPFRKQDVAVKRVRMGLITDARESHFQQRFFAAEAGLVGQLHHPNVVQILDAVADADEPYLVMEYVPGTTLRGSSGAAWCRARRSWKSASSAPWRWATATARA